MWIFARPTVSSDGADRNPDVTAPSVEVPTPRPAPGVGTAPHRLNGAGIAAILLAVVTLSAGSTMVRSSGSPGPVVAFWRLLFGALMWNVWVALKGRSGGRRMDAQVLRITLVPGLLFGINLCFFFTAVGKTPIAHAEFIGSLSPLIIVPIAMVRLGERVPRSTLVLAGAAVCGIALILLTSAATTTPHITGDLLAGAAVVSWCSYLLSSRSVRQQIDTAQFMAGMTTFAAVTVLPVALWFGRGDRPGLGDVSAKGWILITTMAVTSGVVAHGMIVWAQQRVPVSTISIMQLAQPGLGTLWAFVFLDQEVRPIQILGMAIMLSAVGTIAYGAARRQESRTGRVRA